MSNSISRLVTSHAVLVAMLVTAASVPAVAQRWPTSTLTFVIPVAPGGPGDVVGRVLAERRGAILGQQVVLENVPGAGGMVGGSRVAKGNPDGSQFVLGTVGTHAMSQTLYAKPMFNAVTDFAPVVLINEVPLTLTVRKTFPATDLKGFIDYGKANPGKLNFGTGGVGSASHLACVLLCSMTGVDAAHVAYRGGGPAFNDLIAGQLDFMCEATSTALPHVTSGTAKVLAVLTRDRSPAAPNIPTADEQGVQGLDIPSWYALFMHAATPPHIIKRLRDATVEATASSDVRRRLEPLGITMISNERNTPEYLASFLESEIAKWAASIKSSGVQMQ